MSVTVVGSLVEDVLVAVRRLPGRGETVIGHEVTVAPGGKGANQAAAAGRLGGGVHMVGRVGADPAGDRQLAALAGSRVNVSQVHRIAGGADRLGADDVARLTPAVRPGRGPRRCCRRRRRSPRAV